MKAAFFLIITSLLFFTACKKDSFITSGDAAVLITADTLRYDTVFTSVGSVTRSFKIINENKQKLRLSSVKLVGGAGSAFKINVDGIATTEANNIEIAANDSIYVFVQVKVDPAASALPFIIRDSVQVSYNGKDRLVQLEAWGQNAHFLREKEVVSNETWTADLPYVIQGYLHIGAGQVLTIEKGCRIYVHADAPVIVDGSLQVNGEKDTADRVYFQGDRLDEPYRNYPASWPGIYFGEDSKDNILTYVVINNAFQALALQGPSSNASPKLVLNQCIVDNAYDAGIIALNSSITAQNCLVINCGKNIALGKGGDYQFTHCTVASFSNSYINHKEPVLTLSDDLNALFRNCIFWGENGTVEDEVLASGTVAANVLFDHPLWKLSSTPPNVSSILPLTDAPRFDSIDIQNRYYDLRLQQSSPARDAGMNAGLALDLDGRPRPVGLPDLGCFEKQ